MKYNVLGVGYLPQEHKIEKREWLAHGIEFDFVDTIKGATEMLRRKEYICIAIRSNRITYEEILTLREIFPIPVLIIPSNYTAAEGHICANFSAIQYVRAAGYREVAEVGGDRSLQCYLDMPIGERKPLTIITVKDLCVCLEYRSVEIQGKMVELTEKEFDILALLIMNQRQVFTYEMIMDAIWQNDYAYYSRNALSTHISNLRRKLKVTPDVPDHIKSIRGVGYKFEA